jgi:uncharacterized protein YukE
MRALVLLAALVAADRTITQVVKLLEGMLEKSKADGKNDRDLFAHFQCYCDHTSANKTAAIAAHEASIEALAAEIADRTAQSEQLSSEIATLQADMDANAKARRDATAARNLEHTHYEAEAADMQTGTTQLNRALDMLKAVDPLGAQDGSFLQLRSRREDRLAKAAEAARAVSVYLPAPAKKHLKRALAATKAHDGPAGGLAGVLKTFSDTFVENLDSATRAENAAQSDHDVLDAAQLSDYEDMDEAKQAKEVAYGDHQSEIADCTEEKNATEATLAADTAFLAALKIRCKEKRAEFDHRNQLRAAEELAITQAVAILNSDAAFGTFGKVDATSTGATSFVQLRARAKPESYAAAAEALSNAARKLPVRGPARLRLATLATRLVAGENVFDKVLEMLNKCISKIDKEEAADVTKKDWCEAEQSSANDNKGDKESNLGSLEGTISTLQTGINSTLDSQQDATESLATNRVDQAEMTAQREKEHALYLEDVANLEEAERILGKAIEVLTKYYDWLEAHNAPHHYEQHSGKDVMGGNLKRMADASQAELEEACSADPGCSGYTSLGWLKGTLPPQDEWFGAASDLYVKVFDRTSGHAALLQRAARKQRDEPATWGDGVESEGQRDKGAEVLDMLRFILSETTTEKQTADTDEGNSQRDYDSDMADLKEDEEDLVESLETLALTLANQKKSLEEAEEDKSKTAKDLAMIIKYLQDIEPGCTFIQENYETRKQARIDEKTALEGAIDELKATPAFAAGGEEE